MGPAGPALGCVEVEGGFAFRLRSSSVSAFMSESEPSA